MLGFTSFLSELSDEKVTGEVGPYSLELLFSYGIVFFSYNILA